jgi:hypothetical protein
LAPNGVILEFHHHRLLDNRAGNLTEFILIRIFTMVDEISQWVFSRSRGWIDT